MQQRTTSLSGTAIRIPVTLVTGFLGSGKTTLINAVLQEPAFAGTLVIVNEFGEIGLDNALISNAEDGVVLLDSGCLCCAASGTLRDTLIDLFARGKSGALREIRQIIVETSGLANPGPLVATLIGDSALRTRCVLAQVLTLVDQLHGVATLQAYAEARHQVAFADTLVLTKGGQAGFDERRALYQTLAPTNDTAPRLEWDAGQSAAPIFIAQPHVATPAQDPELWIKRMMSSSRDETPLFAATSDADKPAGILQSNVHSQEFADITSHTFRFRSKPMGFDVYAMLTSALAGRYGRKLLRCKGLLPLGPHGEAHVVQGVQGYFAPPRPAPGAVPNNPFLVCILDGSTTEDLSTFVRSLAGVSEHLLSQPSEDNF